MKSLQRCWLGLQAQQKAQLVQESYAQAFLLTGLSPTT